MEIKIIKEEKRKIKQQKREITMNKKRKKKVEKLHERKKR
jgi:hypothetical protein